MGGILLRISGSPADILVKGALYPALYRLDDRGLPSPPNGASDNNRRAKFYSLTPDGRKALRGERASWSGLLPG
jgi:DNA-binding PadR family transcriptional regulator